MASANRSEERVRRCRVKESVRTQTRTQKRSLHPKSLENLKLWQPGQSGNPGGRPKRDEAAEIAKAIFEENGPEIYQAMLKALKSGNSKAFTALADRGYGKAPQHISVGGTGSGGAVGLDVTIRFVKAKA